MMEAQKLIETLRESMEAVARKYAKLAPHRSYDWEDLLQEQTLLLVSIAAGTKLHGEALVKYAMRSCVNLCKDKCRSIFRSRKHCSETVDVSEIAEFVSDGTFEAMRHALEDRERRLLVLQLAEHMPATRRAVIHAILNGHPVAIAAINDGCKVNEALRKATGCSRAQVFDAISTMRQWLEAA